jgi:6-phosphogluconolactonase
LQTISTLPESFSGKSTAAEVRIDEAGRFVYASNRGDDSIVAFAVDGATGTLAPIQFISTEGKTPRTVSLDPTGQYLFAANQNSTSIVLFRIDPTSGKLAPTGKVLNDAPEPSSIVFIPAK